MNIFIIINNLYPKFDSKPVFFGYFQGASVEKTITYVNFSHEKA